MRRAKKGEMEKSGKRVRLRGDEGKREAKTGRTKTKCEIKRESKRERDSSR